MAIAAILFVLFTLLSVAGTFWAADHFRGRPAAIRWGAAVVVFYVILGAAVCVLLRDAPVR